MEFAVADQTLDYTQIIGTWLPENRDRQAHPLSAKGICDERPISNLRFEIETMPLDGHCERCD
jgi:hypothetical protein